MSDILIGHSYYMRFDPKLWRAQQPYPPLGTLYAASFLRARGYHVAVFDAMLAKSVDEWEEALRIEQPAIAVIFEDNFNYLSKMCLGRMRMAAFEMIKRAKRRNCTVIASGSDATDNAEVYISQGVDFVIHGEGEYTLDELIGSLYGTNSLKIEDIAGLSFISKRSSGYARTPKRPLIHDLDSLPFPAWDLIDIQKYKERWLRNHGYFSLNMVTTRGCPFHCNWCAKPIWGQRYHSRSPANVVKEMVYLRDNYNPDHIWFMDDIFGLKPGWLYEFSQLVIQNNVRISFKCLNRADLLLREGDIENLKAAGCHIIWIGAESGSQKILDAMEKGITIDQIIEATKRIHAAGMSVGYFLQFGYPGETREDIMQTIRLVIEQQPDHIGISVSYPLPGTPFHDRVKSEIGKKKNWIDSSDLAALYKSPYPTRYYRMLYRVVHKIHRLSNSGTENNRKIFTSPNQPHKLIFRAIKILKYLVDCITLPVDLKLMNLLGFFSKYNRVNIRPQLSRTKAALPTPQDD